MPRYRHANHSANRNISTTSTLARSNTFPSILKHRRKMDIPFNSDENLYQIYLQSIRTSDTIPAGDTNVHGVFASRNEPGTRIFKDQLQANMLAKDIESLESHDLLMPLAQHLEKASLVPSSNAASQDSLNRKKATNRLAAQKSRQRKKDQGQEMLDTVNQLRVENAALKNLHDQVIGLMREKQS
jgi:hypothetical protein